VTELSWLHPFVAQIFRYGENSPADYHSGNCPYDNTSVDTMIASLQEVGLCSGERVCPGGFLATAALATGWEDF
jgi:hypothetical protein